ncbi:MAG: hypothetical protein IOC92_02610 [Rhodobacter sp.]|nr:hypothetical protein [Rhodobacter sp.]MCA3461901.1 hypothetical protein [Rhodobacter sp.]MCA3464497.1 hypothetical protein [Rhodobacter sp.]MCA3467477.1 hypothetical protein [Rhodobacter sp.]MCA3482809.1 hypothetical protein [Rhodobacter sp.]
MTLTYAQRRNHAAAEHLVSEAFSHLQPEAIAEITARVLTTRFGAARTERVGELIARAGHMAGRGE